MLPKFFFFLELLGKTNVALTCRRLSRRRSINEVVVFSSLCCMKECGTRAKFAKSFFFLFIHAKA